MTEMKPHTTGDGKTASFRLPRLSAAIVQANIKLDEREARAHRNAIEDVVRHTLAPHRRRVGFLAFAGLVRRVADRATSPFMVSVELIETGVFTNAQADALADDIAARIARI